MKKRTIKSKNRKKRIRAAKLMQIIRRRGIIEQKGTDNEESRTTDHDNKEHDGLWNG